MSTGSDHPSNAANHRKTPLVEVKWSSPILTVRPAGPQIGQRESPLITAEVTPFLKSAGKDLKTFLLDVSDVTFMSSLGLGMCIAFRNQAAAAGAISILYGASPEMLGLLTMMRIEKLYTIAKSEEELRRALAK